MDETTRDVVVVGGGAAGCAVAYYLGKAGVKTTMVESRGVGTQASGWSAGGINPLHGVHPTLQPLSLASYQLHQVLWEDVRQTTGEDCQGRLITMIRLVFDDAEMPMLEAVRDQFEATKGFTAHWLESAEVHQLESRVAPTLLRGLMLEGNGVVDSFQYTSLLARAAEHDWAIIRAGTVREIRHTGRRATEVVLDDAVLACGAVVMAMGPWTKAAESWLGLTIPIEPQKGEIVRFAIAGPPLRYDFLSLDVALFSRPEGQVWCGATEEWRGFDTDPSPMARDFLWRRATDLMPSLQDARITQQTACLRPVAPDHFPIVGQAPGWDNVYLATGGAHKGILLSPAMGKAIADLITTGSTTLAIAACAPDRFA